MSVKNFSGFLLTDKFMTTINNSFSSNIIAAMFLTRKKINCNLMHVRGIKYSKTNFSCKCFLLFFQINMAV